MSSADQQAEERKVGVRKLSVGQVQKVGEDVPLQMIDLHQRNVVGDRESFGERYAHQKRSQQTGAAREGDGVDLVDGDAGLFQSCIDHRNDVLLMGSGGQFRNDTAVFLVHGLRSDYVRQECPVADDCGRSVVAGRFYA